MQVRDLGAAPLSPRSHPLTPSVGRRFLRQHNSRPSYTVCPNRLENRFPKPPPCMSGALSADGHIPRMGAHDPGVPRANSSLARPERRHSPRTRGHPHHRNTESRICCLTGGPSEPGTEVAELPMEELPFPRDTALGLCKRRAKGLLWVSCISSKSCRAAPVCSKTSWVGWICVPQAHHCTGEEEQHHQPYPQTGLR